MAKNGLKTAANIALKEVVIAPHEFIPQPALAPIAEKENVKMPKGKKDQPNTKSVYVKFAEPEDLACYERLAADAKLKRYDLATYIMLVLLDAYPAPVEQGELALGAGQ